MNIKKFALYLYEDEINIGLTLKDGFHRDINKNCLSGGFVSFDKIKKQICFYGTSLDFGEFKINDLMIALNNNGYMNFEYYKEFDFFISNSETKFQSLKIFPNF